MDNKILLEKVTMSAVITDVLVKSPFVKTFVAGAFSGTCSTVLFQPLDLVKTRLQKSVNIGKNLGMFKELANVVQQEKFVGLWTGLWPSINRCVPGIGLYFTSLHWLKTHLCSDKPNPIELIILGASARTIAGVAVLPFTVMKTRYESGDFHYKSLSEALKVTYTKEGLRGLCSGLTPTLLRDIPFSGLYLMFYTNLKTFTVDKTLNPAYTNFINGIIAGFLASLVTQPADVIKTNMQLYPKKYGRLKPVTLLIYKESGLIGFWRGIVPRTLRRTLMSAMAWTVYEEVMRTFNIRT
ncbi:solute carrier family 25 member 38 homolog [Plakobranchus ocellatus]|uniref:Mitochondrial glycine transporter n=1 Tax=Plakobranchus ocellatus TaxID=259542 RepID=A0AAV3Y5X2_9GAST|nr:solute carrier family 25 member 38 homolog [Plakobranchus ocellatus]